MIALLTFLFLQSLCARWITSAKARAKTVFGHLKWLGGSVSGFICLPWTFQGECVSACSLVTSSTINSPISGRRVREGCHKKQRMSTERFRLFRACRVHDVINSFFISRWTIFLCVSCKDRFRQQIRFSIRNYFIQHMKNVMKCKVNTGQ